VTNSQKTNKFSPDNVFKVPRTHNNEVNTPQSPVINDNQLPSKKVYISKPPHHKKKDIKRKKKKSSFYYNTEWDTLSLPDKAHHFQVYSAAVVSSDDIAINKNPLVISLTKEDSSSDPEPQNLSQEGWL
jgi:hypothetical protein